MLGGFKNFILRGNLIELATAFIMATAFAAVVTATVDVLMDLIGKVGGTPDFSDYVYKGVSVGAWLTALISFVILAAVVYFFIVLPYTKAKERYFPSPEPGTPEDVKLLQEIRDLLASQTGTGPNGPAGGSTGGAHSA
ncbi:MscL family protein [Nocardioides ferulae]|uniref:MscL family protein n=1 Tax=Nocardioides ferulae TaxID=2340821 RepID=UPI000EAE98A2|nr:MscL family protein [Nocardioides ferulae]